MVPGDRTRYLSDLKVGDEVLVVNSKGISRPVVIGRLKIERRPLMLIKVQTAGGDHNIILQNAETIRLISGEVPVSIVDLKEGDEVLIRTEEGGRHFGTKVEESIVEK
jgi:3-dehydroquinate synthase II